MSSRNSRPVVAILRRRNDYHRESSVGVRSEAETPFEELPSSAAWTMQREHPEDDAELGLAIDVAKRRAKRAHRHVVGERDSAERFAGR